MAAKKLTLSKPVLTINNKNAKSNLPAVIVKTPIMVRFDVDLLNRLNELCAKTGQGRAYVIRKAVEEYLKRAK